MPSRAKLPDRCLGAGLDRVGNGDDARLLGRRALRTSASCPARPARQPAPRAHRHRCPRRASAWRCRPAPLARRPSPECRGRRCCRSRLRRERRAPRCAPPPRSPRPADAPSPARPTATSRSSSPSSTPPAETTSVSAGLPSVSVPVLSSTIAVMLDTFSSVAASLIRMLCRAPMPVPTATAVGVARPRASGQAITTAEIANVSAVIAAAPPKKYHDDKRDDARADRQNHQILRRLVGQALPRRLGVLRPLHQLHDLRQRGVGADLRRPEADAAAAVDRAGDHGVAWPLGDGHALAGDQRFVDAGFAVDAPRRRPAPCRPAGAAQCRRPRTSLLGIVRSWPSRITVACGGTRSNSARSASLVPRRERISIQWPNSTNVTSIAAASKNVSPPRDGDQHAEHVGGEHAGRDQHAHIEHAPPQRLVGAGDETSSRSRTPPASRAPA